MGDGDQCIDSTKVDCAATLVERGVAWLDSGEPDRAVADLDAAFRLGAANSGAHLARGRALIAKGDYDSAIRDLNEALRLDPDDGIVLGFRATARQFQGDFIGAVADYDRAIRYAPGLAWLYNGRGVSLHSLEEYRSAIADYARAIAIDPNDPEAHRNRGLALYAEDECEAAITELSEAIRIGPEEASSYLHRADARRAIGDDAGAIADYDEVIRLDPGEARAFRGRAAAWDAMNEEDQAGADYDQAQRLDDDQPMVGAPMNVTERKPQIHSLIYTHFEPTALEDLTVTERQFPLRVRADLQQAVDQIFGAKSTVSFFCGVRKSHAFDGISFSELLVRDRNNPVQSTPPLYEEINVGEEAPVRCLKNGLWLLESSGTKCAVLLEQSTQFHRVQGVKIQVATPNDPQGFRLSQDFLKRLEQAVQQAESYRGKILSLEVGEHYSGRSSGITVHKLSTVARDQVILPANTLALLERNVLRFVGLRSRLAGLGLATKKGLLFYGPPGTGKTHTIHYLAGALKGHTTLLITAEQVGLLDEYMALARLLQPSIVVIEDVDLIARDRTTMGSPCEEAMLNKLLNEMDGLRPDSEILFVLTTNRAEALEAALASRPGRVDQAIEFPLPDDEGRGRLVRLYARGVEVSDELVRETVGRTEGVSASFIKELMRRSAQFHLERDGSGSLGLEDVASALDELLFSGGSLNRKLLGGRVDEQGSLCGA
jgi:cell division protease FtsH